MQHRSAELTEFLQSLHTAIADSAQADSVEIRLTERIMQALQVEQPSAMREPARLPLCGLLDTAVKNVAAGVSEQSPEQPTPIHPSVLEHAQALHALSSHLTWWHRADAGQWGEPFATGHANATVIGKGGLEERDDVWVGISLVAPNVRYPEHQHPPEEVYLALSRGHWQKDGGAWFEPGIGGLVHNPSDIKHAMRSGPTPLLATWCLYKGVD